MSMCPLSARTIISGDGTHRYRLERQTLPDPARSIAFIMVNPSTADASVDDPTIRRCKGFAADFGYGTLIVGNLFAYRATDIKELKDCNQDKARGLDNLIHRAQIIHDADLIVAAWGPMAKLPKWLRSEWLVVKQQAIRAGKPLHCLGIAKDGHPRHPLMLAKESKLLIWRRPGDIEECKQPSWRNA